jgi:hypothetical protein
MQKVMSSEMHFDAVAAPPLFAACPTLTDYRRRATATIHAEYWKHVEILKKLPI